MIFFKKKEISYKGYSVPDDESGRISLSNHLTVMFLMIISGQLLSSAFPPLNWELLAFVAVAPLIVQSIRNRVSWRLFFYGYLWSMSWSFSAFFWLREINPFIPFGISAVIGLWGGAFALLVSFIRHWCMIPENVLLKDYRSREEYGLGWYKKLFFAVLCGALFVMLEFIRIRMFPWNFIGVTQYKMLWLIQIVRFSGIYGVSFLIVAVNSILAMLWMECSAKMRGQKNSMYSALIVTGVFAIIIFLCCIYGYFNVRWQEENYLKGRKIRVGLVQGDISQRRESTPERAQEALDVYLSLSYKLADMQPQIIIWPETAVPYPYYGGHYVSANYRSGVFKLMTERKIPLLAGSLDFVKTGRDRYELTNSALLFNINGFVKNKYAKINRVPFGEFVPFREFMSDDVAEIFGMGRDLVAGNDPSPLEILPGVRAGMAICYESIFASLARAEANLGANLIIAVNNDAWYPESSEPEQHVANAVFRMIENGLPSVRSGNNGASVVILPSGRISWSMSGHLLNRERNIGVAEVFVKDKVSKTFYTLYGDCFLLILFIVGTVAVIYGFYQYFSVLYALRKTTKEV